MNEKTITLRLAEFATGAHTIPAEVEHAVRRALVDFAGVAAAGTHHEAWHITHGMIRQLGTQGRCRIIGADERTDPLNAALINAIAAHVLDFDDTILPTRAHLSAPLFPALIAEGELNGWRMSQMIEAFAVGFEIAARTNECVYPSIHLGGWQGTAIAGGVGAAAATGRLLGLDTDRMVQAIGVALAGAAGPIATFGSMSKALNVGRAAMLGLQSAYLAGGGFTSHDDMLGKARFLDLFDAAPRREMLVDGLGTTWTVLRNGYKPYPCGFVAHAMIEAVRTLRAKRASAEGLGQLVLRVSPESTQLMGNPDPSTELEAKFSLVYNAAVAWLDGNVTPAAFEPACIGDPRYRPIMRVIEIRTDKSVRQDESFADATFVDGSKAQVHVEHAKGTSIRPMSDEDLYDKFAAALAESGFSDFGALHRLIMTGREEPVAALMDHLAGKKG